MQYYFPAIFFTLLFIGCSQSQTEPHMPEEPIDRKLINIDLGERPTNAKEFYFFNNGMIILLDDGLAPAPYQNIEVDSAAKL